MHTKGPWIHDADIVAHIGADVPEDWEAVCVLESPGEPGAIIAYCHPINGPLIAEAPAMLELLREWIAPYQEATDVSQLTERTRELIARIERGGR